MQSFGSFSFWKDDPKDPDQEVEVTVQIAKFEDYKRETVAVSAPRRKREITSTDAPTEAPTSSNNMAKYNDENLPMAGFVMPEGWKGDNPENPNFKAIGKLSAPVMRKIEPSGPAYLAYARRKLKGRTFSEDDRIEALSKVKKIEDNDDGEISEPEDPMMLQRDAKDWKVRYAT